MSLCKQRGRRGHVLAWEPLTNKQGSRSRAAKLDYLFPQSAEERPGFIKIMSPRPFGGCRVSGMKENFLCAAAQV